MMIECSLTNPWEFSQRFTTPVNSSYEVVIDPKTDQEDIKAIYVITET